jgi:hypothetical protein
VRLVKLVASPQREEARGRERDQNESEQVREPECERDRDSHISLSCVLSLRSVIIAFVIG